jgi:anti-sigma factor RsiW
MRTLPISDADIHAYVDGRLPAASAAGVDEALANDAALAARVAEMRTQNAALRDAFDLVLDEPIPEHLLAAAVPPPSGRSIGVRPLGHRRALPFAFGVAATLVVGFLVGWFVRDALIERAGTPTTFARQAAFAHALYAADANRPVEIWANEEKRLVGWLTKRLGFQVHAPDLGSVGYLLVGGRLVAGNEKPTALFMYENADKERLSLQVRKQASDSGETAFRYAHENGVGVFYWVDDACGYALSGNVDRSQLLKIAHVVYGQLVSADAAGAK